MCAPLVVLAATLACNDKGTEPEPVKYNVYIAALDWVDGVATDPLFILDADSRLEVIDSIPQIGSLYDMEVSPDGRWLYTFVHRGAVYGCPNDSLRRIDLASKEIVWAIPSGLDTRISLLDDGKFILRSWSHCSDNPPGQDLLDAATGQAMKMLPDSLVYMEGPVEGTEVAAIARPIPNQEETPIVAVDVITGEVRGRFVPHLPSGQRLSTSFARLHKDGESVLVMAGLSQTLAWAMVGNLRSGEVQLMQRIYSLYGEGEFSDDGSIAVTGDLSGGLTVFDLDSMAHRPSPEVYGTQVEFIGDSRTVVTCGFGDYFHATDPLLRVDLRALQITDRVELPLPEPLLGAMAVGRRPWRGSP
jgi:hypothetical protein